MKKGGTPRRNAGNPGKNCRVAGSFFPLPGKKHRAAMRNPPEGGCWNFWWREICNV